jgi:5-enolpyruvylshikimate-3-phosphate synthase
LVGEKGPELFTPTTNGTIIPNDFFDSARESLQSTGGAAGVNDDVNSEAFAAAAAAIERNTANIVNRQSTISQESSFNDLVETLGLQQRETIRFETVRVGEMDMVTKDEALKIGADSAKAAEASVFSALRNKPSVRKSIGMG